MSASCTAVLSGLSQHTHPSIGGEVSGIREWQRRAGDWVDSRFPDDTLFHRGLVLGEETGEIQRCILKAAQNIRGGTDHWNAELRKETADGLFGLLALAHRAGFDLDGAMEEAWPAIAAKVYPQSSLVSPSRQPEQAQ